MAAAAGAMGDLALRGNDGQAAAFPRLRIVRSATAVHGTSGTVCQGSRPAPRCRIQARDAGSPGAHPRAGPGGLPALKRSGFTQGEWRDGPLPSVKQLQQEHGVGRDTVLRAVEILRDEDLVFTVPPAAPTSAQTPGKCRFSSSLGDHLGTTRYPCGRTTRRRPPVVSGRLNPSELRRRLLPRPGGQGVAGSNPAVPTGQRLVAAQIGLRESHAESHSVISRPWRGRPAAVTATTRSTLMRSTSAGQVLSPWATAQTASDASGAR